MADAAFAMHVFLSWACARAHAHEESLARAHTSLRMILVTGNDVSRQVWYARALRIEHVLVNPVWMCALFPTLKSVCLNCLWLSVLRFDSPLAFWRAQIVLWRKFRGIVHSTAWISCWVGMRPFMICLACICASIRIFCLLVCPPLLLSIVGTFACACLQVGFWALSVCAPVQNTTGYPCTLVRVSCLVACLSVACNGMRLCAFAFSHSCALANASTFFLFTIRLLQGVRSLSLV